MKKLLIAAAVLISFLEARCLSDTVSYVFVNTTNLPLFFEVFNPHSTVKDAEAIPSKRTRLYLVPEATAIVIKDANFINAGQDATVFVSRPIGATLTRVTKTGQSVGVQAGVSGEVSGRSGDAEGAASAYADFQNKNSQSNRDHWVYDKQPVPAAAKLGVNYMWVPRERCTTPFAKQKGLDEEKWGYVLYITHGHGGNDEIFVPGLKHPVDYYTNFGKYN